MAVLTTLHGFVLLVALGLGLYALVLYNGLVQVKHSVDQAFANIDVLLKQRHDELPRLIDTLRSTMGYESELLERITRLRAKAGAATSDAERLQAEGHLSAGLGRLFAVAEGYPELKANRSFLQLQSRISALEEQIAHRREFYNEAVNINNVRMEQLPDRALAGFAGLVRRALFEASADERADVVIGDALRLPFHQPARRSS
jgi:LemA protein